MSQLLEKIENSFRASLRGEETIHNLIWKWGVPAYFVAFFASKIFNQGKFVILSYFISSILISYFIWHLYAVIKCRPRKPALTPEEKMQIRIQKRKDFSKRLLRKLLLQEPIFKWNNVVIISALDLLCIAQFLEQILP